MVHAHEFVPDLLDANGGFIDAPHFVVDLLLVQPLFRLAHVPVLGLVRVEG